MRNGKRLEVWSPPKSLSQPASIISVKLSSCRFLLLVSLGRGLFFFLLTTKLSEERSYGGSEMQLYVSESPCRFVSPLLRVVFVCLFVSAERNGKILDTLKFCFQV